MRSPDLGQKSDLSAACNTSALDGAVAFEPGDAVCDGGVLLLPHSFDIGEALLPSGVEVVEAFEDLVGGRLDVHIHGSVLKMGVQVVCRALIQRGDDRQAEGRLTGDASFAECPRFCRV